MPRQGHGGGNQGATLQQQVTRNANTSLIEQAIRFAMHQRGVPYTWGGTTRSGGFDCSGLVYAAYRAAGYSGIGRTTYDQITQGTPVSMANLRPGDIVFPSSHHEGLYIGNGKVLEAPHTGDVVKVVPLSYFGFMTARRLIGGGGGVVPPRVGIGGVSRNGLPVPHPSINPQMFQQWLRSMGQQQNQMMHQFQVQQLHLQDQFQNQLKVQAAQQRQATLANQLQQQETDRRNAGALAQRNLIPGGRAEGLVGSVGELAAQNKMRADDLRSQALRRAGIGG